jgi:hypothetical protein
MAKVITDDKHYKDIADVLRYRGNSSGKYTPAEMAGAIDATCEESYSKGAEESYNNGYDFGYAKGTEDGVQSEYDRFWDAFQDFGNRTDYTYAFRRINADYIRPKYKVQNLTMKAETMFQYSTVKEIEAAYFDMTRIDKLSGTAYGMFNACPYLEKIEDINIPATDYTGTWANCPELHTIAIVRCTNGKAFSSAFSKCGKLKNVEFTGSMNTNGLDLSPCVNLSKASIESVFGILASSSSSRSVKLSEAAVKKAFETSIGANDGVDSAEWAALVATKPSNWTITLA